jgi:hypothetical protein
MAGTPGVGRSTRAQDLSYAEIPIVAEIASGVLTIDLSKGTEFIVAMDANITSLVIDQALRGKGNAFTLFCTGNGSSFTQVWTNVLWAGGTAPTLTTTVNGIDILTFLNRGNNAQWFGFTAGQAFA